MPSPPTPIAARPSRRAEARRDAPSRRVRARPGALALAFALVAGVAPHSACRDDAPAPAPTTTAPPADPTATRPPTAAPGTGPDVATADATPRAPRTTTPACSADLVEGVVKLSTGATPIAIDLDREDPRRIGVAVFADGDAHVLIAFARPWFVARGADPDGALWRVPCADPAEAEALAQRDGADFAQAALAPDGWTLYFSDAAGLAALDLGTREVTVLTDPPPADESCWSGPETPQRDLVLAVSADGLQLSFARGGPCGYEADWVGRPWVLLDPADPVRRRARARHPIAALARAGESVWLSDGGACDEPGVVAPATRGAVWRSDDRGATWARVQVAAGDVGLRTHARAILTDPGHPERLLVHGARCRVAGEDVGGQLFASDDGGATWRHAPLPDGETAVAVVAVNGRLDQLIAWVPGERRFVSDDLGRTFSPLDPREPPVAPKVAPLQLGELALSPQDDGLYARRGPGSRPERVFPPTPAAPTP